jgi:hypothetical protein
MAGVGEMAVVRDTRVEQFHLFADRVSTETMRANQLRVYLSAMAYVLLCGLRRLGLKATELAQAQVATIRTKLFKIGAGARERAPGLVVDGLQLSLAGGSSDRSGRTRAAETRLAGGPPSLSPAGEPPGSEECVSTEPARLVVRPRDRIDPRYSSNRPKSHRIFSAHAGSPGCTNFLASRARFQEGV